MGITDGRPARRPARRRVVSWLSAPLVVGLVGAGVACGGGDDGVGGRVATSVSEEPDGHGSDGPDPGGSTADGPDADDATSGDAGPDEAGSVDPDDPPGDATDAATPPGPGVVEGTGPEDLGEGLVLDVSLVSDGGVFDPNLDATVDVVIDLEGLDGPALFEVTYDLDIVLTSITGTLTGLVGSDGSGAERGIVRRGLGLPELGSHTFVLSGVVEATDGSFELPFERTIRFVTTEDGEAPVEEIELVGGALTVEVSRRWSVVDPALSFTRLQEPETVADLIGLDLADTQVLVALAGRDHRGVIVRRALRHRYLDDLEVLARSLSEVFDSGEYSEPEPVEVGGLAGWRVVRTLSSSVQTIDLLEAGDEVFIVQATSGPDPAHVEEVAAVRDSLRFHPDEFDRLTHVIVQEIWLTVEGERYFRIDTTLPADWEIDPEAPARLTSPDGRRLLVRQSFPVGDLTLEEFVVDVIEQSVPVGAEATYELGERGGLDAATISIVGDPIGDAKVVILTDGDLFETTTVRDDPDDPDPALISLIAASVRPVGPPSTN